jgi:hypothetical protein
LFTYAFAVLLLGEAMFAALIFLAFGIVSPGPVKDAFEPIINLFLVDKAAESKKYTQSLFLWTMRK